MLRIRGIAAAILLQQTKSTRARLDTSPVSKSAMPKASAASSSTEGAASGKPTTAAAPPKNREICLPPRQPLTRIDVVLFFHHLLFLALHLHHLHTFSHPRTDSRILVLIELLLCTRHLLIIEVCRLQARAVSAGVSIWLATRIQWEGFVVIVTVGIFLYFSMHDNFDACLVFLPEVVRRLVGPALPDHAGDVDGGFAEGVQSILFTSFDAAFIIGVLPAAFARNQPILHMWSESVLIALVVFCNTLVLSLLHLLRAVHRGDAFGAVLLARSTSDAIVVWTSPHPEMRLNLGGACYALPDVSGALADEVARSRHHVLTVVYPDMVVTTPPKPRAAASADERSDDVAASAPLPWSAKLLPLYLQHADRVHLLLVGVQAMGVGVLLVGYLWTDHWRSHGLMVVCNYLILGVCIRFRRQPLS